MILVLNQKTLTTHTLDGPGIVKIDRTTGWGNPYKLDRWTRQEAADKYRKHLELYEDEQLLALDGKTLVCHCAPKLCHGNALQYEVAKRKLPRRMWVLVTGEAPRGRGDLPAPLKASYRAAVHKALAQLPSTAAVIHGGARGVDSLAHEWCLHNQRDVVRWPADWEAYGKLAGPMRNQYMLDMVYPDLVLAFHTDLDKSVGTKDMVRRAQRDWIDVDIHTIDPLEREGRLWDGPVPG